MVERSHIPLVVLDGRDAENLSRAILTGEYSGTVVSEKTENPAPVTGPVQETRRTITYFYVPDTGMMARGSRVAWSILERLGRFDGGSNPPYPIGTVVLDQNLMDVFYEKTGRCEDLFSSV